MRRALLATAVTLAAPLHAQETFDTGELLDQLTRDMEGIRELVDESQEAPSEGGLFQRGQGDVAADLNRELDKVLDLLLGETYGDARAEIIEMDRRTADLEGLLDELKIDRMDAQPSAEIEDRFDRLMGREFASGSTEDLARRIERTEAAIAESRTAKAEAERRFRRTLSETYGIELTREQAQSLLYQVNGSSIVEASMVFSALALVEERLAAIRQEVTSEEVLRRYYGVAAALRLVVVRLHERHLAQYDEEWLPALEGMSNDTDALLAETEEALRAETSPVRRRVYEGNLAIQERIEGVIDDYGDLLADRRDITEESLAEARADAAVALNALKTLESAAMLFDQFQLNESEFGALSQIKPQELIPLEDEEVFENYLDISRALAGS
ncbi:MAG: hypothetical protein ACU0CO_08420 [Shimia sp.]